MKPGDMQEQGYYDDPERYDAEYSFYTVDMGFYLARARRHGDPVLSLGCGTGRVLFHLAAAGLRVDGLDTSPGMLDRARTRAVRAGGDLARRVGLFEADMRDFSLPRRYRTIIAPLNCLMHLTTDEALIACLGCVRRHLAPGGRFVFDLANPRPELLSAHGGPDGIPLRDIQVRAATYLQRERHRYHPSTGISDTTYIFEPRTPGVRPFVTTLRLRMLAPGTIDRLLAQSGLRLLERTGSFEGRPFDPGCTFQVIEACRQEP